MWKKDTSELVVRPPASPTPASASPAPVSASPAPVPERQRGACIGKGIVIRGDVSGSEDLLIDGQVVGRVDLSGHHLVVGVGASVAADVLAKIVSISGTVTGNVKASERVEIRETGAVEGDIQAPRIAILDGAAVRGHVDTNRSEAGAQDNPAQLRLVAS